MILANMAGGMGGMGVGGPRGGGAGMQRMPDDIDRRNIGTANAKRGDSSIRGSEDGGDSDKEEDRKRRWMTKDQARVSKAVHSVMRSHRWMQSLTSIATYYAFLD